MFQSKTLHGTVCVPPGDPHCLLAGMGAASERPESNLHTPPSHRARNGARLSQAEAWMGFLCTRIISQLCQGAGKRMSFPPLIAKTLKSSVGQEGGREIERQGIKSPEEKKEGGRGLRSPGCRKPSTLERRLWLPQTGAFAVVTHPGSSLEWWLCPHSFTDFQGKVIEHSSTELNVNCQGAGAHLPW